jgi:hypothetical protein
MTKIKIAKLFLYAALLVTLTASMASHSYAQSPPKEGTRGPGGCTWRTGTFRITGAGSNSLFYNTYAYAFIANSKGSSSFTGGYLSITNGSRTLPFWFGRSGVINEVVPSKTTRLFYLAIYQGKNPPNTVVNILARYCK